MSSRHVHQVVKENRLDKKGKVIYFNEETIATCKIRFGMADMVNMAAAAAAAVSVGDHETGKASSQKSIGMPVKGRLTKCGLTNSVYDRKGKAESFFTRPCSMNKISIGGRDEQTNQIKQQKNNTFMLANN